MKSIVHLIVIPVLKCIRFETQFFGFFLVLSSCFRHFWEKSKWYFHIYICISIRMCLPKSFFFFSLTCKKIWIFLKNYWIHSRHTVWAIHLLRRCIFTANVLMNICAENTWKWESDREQWIEFSWCEIITLPLPFSIKTDLNSAVTESEKIASVERRKMKVSLWLHDT